MLRAVVDANVYVSALIAPAGPPGEVLSAAASGAFRLVSSPAIAEEVCEVLQRPRVRKAIRHADPLAWFEHLHLLAEVVDDRTGLPQVCADPDDDVYVNAALEGRADFVVTGDAALLAVKEHDRVRMVTPAAFLRLLGAEPGR